MWMVVSTKSTPGFRSEYDSDHLAAYEKPTEHVGDLRKYLVEGSFGCCRRTYRLLSDGNDEGY